MDNIIKLLRELNNRIDTKGYIIISEESKNTKIQYSFYPVDVSIDNELYLEDKDGYYFKIINLDNFELIEDECGDCIEFVLRSKKDERYYGICF